MAVPPCPQRRGLTALADSELIDLLRRGDDSAIGELFRRHAPTATRAARTYTGSHHDADDVVADVFASIWEAIRNGHGPTTHFEPYMISAVKNRSRGVWVTGTVEELAEELSGQEAHEPSTDALASRAFAWLTDREKEMIWLTAVEGLTSVEAGREMALSTRAAVTLKFRATKAFAEAYLSEYAATSGRPECRQFSSSLSRYVRGRCSARARHTVESHLAVCPGCEQLVGDLRNLNTRLRSVGLPVIAILATWRDGFVGTIKGIVANVARLKPIAFVSAAGAVTIVPAIALFGGDRSLTDPDVQTVERARDETNAADDAESVGPALGLAAGAVATTAGIDALLPGQLPMSANSTSPSVPATDAPEPPVGQTPVLPTVPALDETELSPNPVTVPKLPAVTASAEVTTDVDDAALNVELEIKSEPNSVSADASVAAETPVADASVDAGVEANDTGINASVEAEVPEVTVGDVSVVPSTTVAIDLATDELTDAMATAVDDLLGG